MSVTVVTDSASALTDEVAASLGIVVVPLRIMVGDRSYKDGTISHRELVEIEETVTTSGPSPQDFLEAIEGRATEDGVVVLTVSHEIAASTYLSAETAAKSMSVPVTVIDTQTAAGSQSLVALAAGRAAQRGWTLKEVEAEARRVIERVELVADLPSLDHLARSGHVPGAAAWAARWIGLHVVIALRQGRVRPLKPTLGPRASMDYIVRACVQSRPHPSAGLHLAGLHALRPEQAEELVERVREQIEPVEVFIGSFGTGMIIHSGPGVIGLAWWWDPNEPV